MAEQAPAAQRHCVCCGSDVDFWVPWSGADTISPFLLKLDAIGSNVIRFQCPNCWCTDRDRHLQLYFQRRHIDETLPGSAVLHIAPEPTPVSYTHLTLPTSDLV